MFVPRHRTEFLAGVAARLTRERAAVGRDALPVVVDLCCGIGAIGALVADVAGPVDLVAADIDPAAVRAARRNLEPRGARVFEGDLFEALPDDLRGRVDVLAVNAPYVPTDEIALMPPEARDHEARVALDGGGDGLDVHRRVAASAARWLAPVGSCSSRRASGRRTPPPTSCEQGGLVPRILHDDDDGTIVVGERRSAG